MRLWKRGGQRRGLVAVKSLSAVRGDMVLLFIMPFEVRAATYSGGGSGRGGTEKGKLAQIVRKCNE